MIGPSSVTGTAPAGREGRGTVAGRLTLPRRAAWHGSRRSTFGEPAVGVAHPRVVIDDGTDEHVPTMGLATAVCDGGVGPLSGPGC